MAVQKVNAVALQSLQGELTHNFDSVKSQLHALQATIDGLEGHWRGIGAGAFHAKQTQINNNMARIGKLLLTFQEAIQAARTIAGNTEDEVGAALRSVGVTDGPTGDAGTRSAASNLSTY
jgi:WXG100 family type VII secretion target